VAVERIDGVVSARFLYPEGTGSVTYDTTATTTEVIIAELGRATGFRAAAVKGR
jgi:hypothetical protein